jgi:hypothetical protein
MMTKPKVNLTNVIAYIQGYIRYHLYYSKFKFLIRKHILEQIDFRIKYMDKECYENGSCKLCGCATTALQMANKSCDKPCYPKMMNKILWEGFILGVMNIGGWKYNPKPEQFISYKAKDSHITYETLPQNQI